MSAPEQETTEPQNIQDDAPKDDNVQHASQQGRDPNTEGPDHPKMTGTGAAGSHSAFFGLTPDGKKDENTQSGSTPIKPAHSKQANNSGTASGGGSYSTEEGSRDVGSSAVADQMHDPQVGESAHGGDAQQSTSGPGDKAGTGSGMMNPSQGTGDVKPSEPGTGGEKASLVDQADPNIDADGDGKAGVAD